MEFLDDDCRPRFLLQSRSLPASAASPQTYQPINKQVIFITISFSSVLLALSFLFLQTEPFKSLFIWLSLSLFVGPFAPPYLTGGNICVGQGPIVEFHEQGSKVEDDTTKKRRQKQQHKTEGIAVSSAPAVEIFSGLVKEDRKVECCESVKSVNNESSVTLEEKEWSEEDINLLKKQLLKHPAGKPKRWEAISEAFRGQHRLENIIKKAKELAEKKLDDDDAYVKFLKSRKPLDKRTEIENEGSDEIGDARRESDTVCWSAGDDIALLNALKAFPRDVSMRWEKISAAVPGKSKAVCMKRVAELKRDFRSSKAANEG